MKSAARMTSLIYLALTALFVGYLGFIWAFMPADHMPKLGITVTELAGLNTLKSIMGTGLLGLAGCCVFFILDQRKWFRPMLLLAGIMASVRIFSLVIDGIHERMAIYAALEILIVMAVITALKTAPEDQ